MIDLLAAPEAPAPSNGAKTTTIGALAAALAKAQAAFPKILKDREAKIETKSGSEYRYRYSDLASLLEAVRKPLSENGLALTQPIRIDGAGHHVLVTRLLHVSGEKEEGEMRLHHHDRPQDLGSEITYKRRYCAAAMLGIASEEDDDGAAAQQASGGRRRGTSSGPKPGLPAAEIGNPDRPAGDPEAYRDEAQQMLPADRALPPVAESLAAFEAGSRICPSCQRQTIRKGAKQYGGGWFCSTRDGGCGAKYRAGAAPAGAAPPAPPAEGADDNRAFMVGAIRRKVEPLTPVQRHALKGDFLGGKTVDDATTEDVHRLYLFLGDPQAVTDWWAQRP